MSWATGWASTTRSTGARPVTNQQAHSLSLPRPHEANGAHEDVHRFAGAAVPRPSRVAHAEWS